MLISHFRTFTTGLIVTVLLVTGSTLLQAEQVPPSITSIPDTPTPSQAGMSASATKVLHHIVEARFRIHKGESARAKHELHQAVSLIELIKAVRPKTRIANHIWVAERRLDYQKPQAVALDLIPIEISLTDLEDVVSARRARRHLQDTQAHLDRGDSEAARKELKQLTESLAQTEVDLPLNSTEQHISKALALLDKGESAKADEALSRAEAGVQFVSLGSSVPLAKARRSLWQAMENYSAGHHEAVEAQLTLALQWLERVKAGKDSKIGHEAQQLRREINELLDQESHKTPEAESALAGFWHRTVGLVEHQAEKLYHAWRDQESENHLYRQLIDAKMHLFYAEHELFVSHDADDAKQELKETIQYLQAAATETTGERKVRIEALIKEVEALASLSDNPDTKAHDQYDKALTDIRLMVKGM